MQITAATHPGDQDRPLAEVRVTTPAGRQVTFVIHESLLNPDTINVEIDGDLLDDQPSLRIHLNDQLVVDTKTHPGALEDLRFDERTAA